MTDDQNDTLKSFDGRDWALAFLSSYEEAPDGSFLTESNLTVWFANAIMWGYDERRKHELTNFDRVGEFNKKFDLPHYGDRRGAHEHIDNDAFLFRLQFILEETIEIMAAHRARDMPKIADGIADLLYVVYGLAHFYGLPIDRVFAEVQRANITKERSSGSDDPRSTRKSALDVVKPDGWKPPDIAGVLGIRP